MQRNKAPKRFFSILASFLIGYLTATVFDFTSLSSWVNTHLLSKGSQGKPQVQAKAKVPELPKPNFEFYTLLAKDGHTPATVVAKPQVGQPMPGTTVIAATTAPVHEPGKTIVTEAKPVSVANADKDSYLIQLAAFKNKQDAEHMKAALTLKGFTVSINATSQQQGAWFRVIAGPFNSRALAEKTQLGLAQNERIKGIIRKANV
ncbi:MAG: SPOR domain-containing protein [Tatlockia sp.]|nr:SPOR domain-containing protein [Tatlockia sp.]